MQEVIFVKNDKDRLILKRLVRLGNLTATPGVYGGHYNKPQGIPCDMTIHILTEVS